MSGKDLIDSVHLSSRICKVLGGTPPETFIYELFLDENGEKISKSRGNGLTIDEWLSYASPESLQPLYVQVSWASQAAIFDVIPKTVDEYLNHLSKFRSQKKNDQLDNPLWFIHGDISPVEQVPVSFAMLLNLVSACNTDETEVLWGFLRRYAPGANPSDNLILNEMVSYAIRFYQDFILPTRSYRAPDLREQKSTG